MLLSLEQRSTVLAKSMTVLRNAASESEQTLVVVIRIYFSSKRNATANCSTQHIVTALWEVRRIQLTSNAHRSMKMSPKTRNTHERPVPVTIPVRFSFSHFFCVCFLWLLQFMSSYLYICHATNFLRRSHSIFSSISRLLNSCCTENQLLKSCTPLVCTLNSYINAVWMIIQPLWQGKEGLKTQRSYRLQSCPLSIHTLTFTYFCFPLVTLGMSKHTLQ